MTHIASNGSSSSPLVLPFSFPNESVSWAGPNGLMSEFCFGTEDGKIMFAPMDGGRVRGFPIRSEHPEAVNGAAFLGSAVAVSTRRDITFLTLPPAGSVEAHRAVFNCGSHGVIATKGGYFIAPLGPTGLMKVRASEGEEQPVTISRIADRALDYYKVVDLRVHDRPDVLACAVRFGGIATTELAPDSRPGRINSLTFPGLDVVDVCSLVPGTPAVVAAGKNGTLVLFRDVLLDRSPIALKFDEIRGTTYRVFCAQDGIFLLTSVGLYGLVGVARRFLSGEPVNRTPTQVLDIPLTAIDANLCGERWLLVVMPDRVLRFDLHVLINDPSIGDVVTQDESYVPRNIDPSWETHEEPAELTAVA